MANQIDNRLFISNNRYQKVKKNYLQNTEKEITHDLEFYIQPNITQQQEQNKVIFRHTKRIYLPSTFIKGINEGGILLRRKLTQNEE